MQTIIFGIPNCDTIKKARKWLANNNLEYNFHDYRKDGIDEQWLEQTESALGWEQMLNKRGTTFRQLPAEEKENLDREKALKLLQTHPAMIKRPILLHNNEYFIGFTAAQYEGIFHDK